MTVRILLTAALVVCLAASAAHAQPKPPAPRKPGPAIGEPLHLGAPPPVLTVLNTSPIYEYRKIALPMKIEHYPFEELDPNALPRQMGDFIRIPGITYAAPHPQRQKDGSVTFSVIGYFIGTGSRVVIRMTSPSKSDPTVLNVSATITKAARVTTTVTNTWSLKDRLAPRLVGSGLGAFCDGQPPIGSALGIVEYNGKLSFFGRSGPVGTACVFGLKELVVKDGVIGASWKVIKSGPGDQCRASAGLAYNMTRATVTVDENGFVGDAVLFSDAREVSDSGVVFATDNTDPVTVLKPTIIQYSCPITLGTDVRTIRFVLDSVTFVGPPGQRFP